jgi:hypothetical protein
VICAGRRRRSYHQRQPARGLFTPRSRDYDGVGRRGISPAAGRRGRARSADRGGARQLSALRPLAPATAPPTRARLSSAAGDYQGSGRANSANSQVAPGKRREARRRRGRRQRRTKGPMRYDGFSSATVMIALLTRTVCSSLPTGCAPTASTRVSTSTNRPRRKVGQLGARQRYARPTSSSWSAPKRTSAD